MARIGAVIPDLLFGSKVQAALEQAGHEVDLLSSESDAWEEAGGIDILVVDLTTDAFDGVQLVDSLKAGGELHGVRVLGFFAHPDLTVVMERVWGQTVATLVGERATAWRKSYLPRVVYPFDVTYTEEQDPGPGPAGGGQSAGECA